VSAELPSPPPTRASTLLSEGTGGRKVFGGGTTGSARGWGTNFMLGRRRSERLLVRKGGEEGDDVGGDGDGAGDGVVRGRRRRLDGRIALVVLMLLGDFTCDLDTSLARDLDRDLVDA